MKTNTKKANVKVSAKTSNKSVKTVTKRSTKKVVVPVKTGVNPEWKNIRQFDSIGSLNLEYGNVYRLSPEFGHRYRFEVQKDKSVLIFKFSRSGRKFRYIAESKSLETAKREVNRGKYRDVFAI